MSSKQNFRSRTPNAKWMLQIQNVCFFAYGWSWSEFFIMAAKSPGVSRLAFYIYFDLCALLDTASVIVSMILPAKKDETWAMDWISACKGSMKDGILPTDLFLEFIFLLLPRFRPANLFYMGQGFLLQTEEGALAYVENGFSFLASLMLCQLWRIIPTDW